MFAIPPALPAIRTSLGLSYSAVGSITSLMVIAVGVASIPAALLAGRFGARRLVALSGVGLLLTTLTLTLPPAVFWVFFGSAALAVAISVAQPPLAVLIRRWFPANITRASNLYGNGLIIGNVAGAALSPYLVALLGWRNMFFVWAGVVLPGVALWAWLAPRDRVAAPGMPLRSIARDPRVWQLAGLFTFQNLAYYTVATWLPFLLRGSGPGYLALCLLFLNCIPIVPLLALSALRWQYALSTPYYALAGLATGLGALGMLFGLTGIAWLLAFMVGLGAAAAFIGALALPALVANNEAEAAGFSALMFAVGYLLAFAGPLSAGLLVDATKVVAMAFWPAVAGGLLMAAMGVLVPRLLARTTQAQAAA
jgi:CP family cyanate transporter-like MFS transporter